MAQLKCFSIRDTKVSAYMRPVWEYNEINAIRGLTTAVNMPKEQSQVAMFPQDFDLYQVAEFDDQTGVVEVINPPRFVISATNCIQKPEVV